jgi:hypothetical protein
MGKNSINISFSKENPDHSLLTMNVIIDSVDENTKIGIASLTRKIGETFSMVVSNLNFTSSTTTRNVGHNRKQETRESKSDNDNHINWVAPPVDLTGTPDEKDGNNNRNDDDDVSANDDDDNDSDYMAVDDLVDEDEDVIEEEEKTTTKKNFETRDATPEMSGKYDGGHTDSQSEMSFVSLSISNDQKSSEVVDYVTYQNGGTLSEQEKKLIEDAWFHYGEIKIKSSCSQYHICFPRYTDSSKAMKYHDVESAMYGGDHAWVACSCPSYIYNSFRKPKGACKHIMYCLSAVMNEKFPEKIAWENRPEKFHEAVKEIGYHKGFIDDLQHLR